ncbi:Holliday junction branch migration protein RuvA [Roseinatronobacter bogoriensis]|uniref:Holliday junction branch migration complex subunit RuvA n=1 Tax=Roseinatronobacter bogoriensis subsp. barguzinensis TaxID=441209 RepID=A0A2K8KGF2_9RHOB|nr:MULTISPECIES: Holliday junction branch migration protein RuvA [Rhodobaca]ATX66835.1 Holliday junction branch migration protein RuvA [Rhodobaca barguzinensis]MBB4206303.1 Holliday junction DNA helicase RuvA [Rhodobaca bogoriensis DSM 18756]TDW41048.1 Holliday junction DNA helicase subunit RuvA [Rhodobaca barguzinensis]TDY74774.1 Holliday junction DNA helicase subunit RuvA [Rhodobaca bogoriensis DSM 18756]
MIGKLTGVIDHRASDHVLLDVRGVGYIVYVSERTLMALPGRGEAAALYIDMVVREDLMQLFGFPTLLEKEWHRVLTSVQGVGAKASLAILGALGPEGVSRAIALGDSAALRKAPGVGPKLALRIANELKDKAPALMAVSEQTPAAPAQSAAPEGDLTVATPRPASPAPAPRSSAVAEAMSALGNLGYGPSDAARAVAEAQADTPDADTPTLIRAALRLLAPKG